MSYFSREKGQAERQQPVATVEGSSLSQLHTHTHKQRICLLRQAHVAQLEGS